MKSSAKKDITLGIIAMIILVLMLLGIPRLGEKNHQANCDTIIDSLIEDPVMTRQDTIHLMAQAFSMQESKENPKAVSPCGKYVGCLQMSEIMVREANRILGEDVYIYDDRLSRHHSYEMFRVVMEHHNPLLDLDRAVDIWNRGAPLSYRNNVKNNFTMLLVGEEL